MSEYYQRVSEGCRRIKHFKYALHALSVHAFHLLFYVGEIMPLISTGNVYVNDNTSRMKANITNCFQLIRYGNSTMRLYLIF